MNVRTIAITQPLINHDGKVVSFNDSCTYQTVEEFIAYVARVSNPSNQSNTLTSKKLLKYLLKNKHYSPFQMVNIVLEINTTRDIGRQILRHEWTGVQEFSQRYANINELGVFHIREARLQDNKNRQNSIETEDKELQKEWFHIQDELQQQATEAYKWAIEHNIAKEQARVVLPEGMTPCRMYLNYTLRGWIFYCLLRMSHGTQKEHMEIAKECWSNILEHFPSLEELIIE